MADLSKKASLFTINETTHTNLLKENSLKQFSDKQNFHLVDMRHPAVASMALFLMGCGGGDSSSDSGVGNSNVGNSNAGSSDITSSNTTSSNTTNSPVDNVMDKETPTDIDAARFLQQAQFSSSKEEIAYVKRIGISRWLDQQFSMPISITGYQWLLQQGHNTAEYRYSDRPGDWMIWQQLLSSKDTTRKRMSLALSEILVLSSIELSLPHRGFAIGAYWDLLNKHAFGNFRDLLKAITTNMGMGAYLDLRRSIKANDRGRRPDENYAREVMQLFTIGLVELNIDGTSKISGGKLIETYTQDTVSNIAQALTGWTVDNRSNVTGSITYTEFTRNPMINIPSRHDTRSATFFGVTVPAGTSGEQALEIVVDTLFNHPNVAPFICKQLIQRLVTSNPSPDYIRRVATVFNNDDRGVRGNLKAVLQAILMDKEARTLPNRHPSTIGKVREPMIRLIQWVHTFTNRQSVSGEWKISETSNRKWFLNQSPLRSPSVFNYFDADYSPSTANFIKNGIVAPELHLHNETSTVGYINHIKRVIEQGIYYGFIETIIEIKPDYREEMKLYNQPKKLVAHLNLILCGGQMSPKTIGLITVALESLTKDYRDWKENRIYLAVFMTMVSPDYLVQR